MQTGILSHYNVHYSRFQIDFSLLSAEIQTNFFAMFELL